MVYEMSEKDVKSIVHDFYVAVCAGDTERMSAFLAKDAVLEWASFKFEGEDRIRRWSKELKQMFPQIIIKENSLTIKGSRATHSFVIYVTFPDGRRGILPATGIYDLKEGRIQHITIALSPGVILLSKDEVDS